MACGNNAAWTNNELRIDRINYFRIGNGIDLVERYYARVPADSHFVATTNNVQMANANVIAQNQFLNSENHIKMSNFNIVFNHTLFGVDNAKTETHTLSHPIAKQQAIARPHQK